MPTLQDISLTSMPLHLYVTVVAEFYENVVGLLSSVFRMEYMACGDLNGSLLSHL